MHGERQVQVRRIYEEPGDRDGKRILVDGLWPRGVPKAEARLDEWLRPIAPSSALRTWYRHAPERFGEFARRYRAELAEPARAAALDHLRELSDAGPVTLLTATKAAEISQAAVLRDLLRGG
jgi:uncharacterized protein YeaO (DUF488 family)